MDQEEAPEHFLQPNLHQKMVMVTVWLSAAHRWLSTFHCMSQLIEKYFVVAM
ncbi:hypothetical protein [Klebsiella pneumoniae]